MILDSIGLLSLAGDVGSNPELVSTYPLVDFKENELKELIEKSLPEGIEPNSFCTTKFKNHSMFSYVFATKGDYTESRRDLVSIVVIINDKKVRIKDLEVLFRTIIEKMIAQDMSTQALKESLDKIYEGINLEKKINIKDLIIDPIEIIKKKKLNIKRDKEKLEGRIF